MSNATLDYYNANAASYSEDTVSVDFSETQERFLKYFPAGAKILDFGCGSGRDAKYFLEKDYVVDAIDGSKELCKLARVYTGIDVKEVRFEDFSGDDLYDGIWACGSLLHLEWNSLISVFQNMVKALKKNGVIYASFKYGDFSGERNGRFFTEINEEKLNRIMIDVIDLEVKEFWISTDVRKNRSKEKWMNIILSQKVLH